MPGFLQRVGSVGYRLIARVAASHFGQNAAVSSVYARRSVAAGEVDFGRSDIDLHILVDPQPDVPTEAALLRDLANRHARLKRVLQCVGDCDMSTRSELRFWYRAHAYTWHRDRGWLKLYGKDFVRPDPRLSGQAERDSLLWWFFWAWERFPRFAQLRSVRTCSNLFLDMLNAYWLYTGEVTGVLSRAALGRLWLSQCPPSEEGRAWQRAARRGFWGDHGFLLPWLYAENLKLSETLTRQTGPLLEGTSGGRDLQTQVPFTFSPRHYLLVDPSRHHDVRDAFAAMQRDPGMFLTSENALKLYLQHRNPWEYTVLRKQNRDFAMAPPSNVSWQRAVSVALHREIPRGAGFSARWTADHGRAIGLRYAQCCLYADHGVVALGSEDLVRRYELHHGRWPYTGQPSRDDYCLRDYPITCATIDALKSSFRVSRTM